CISILRLIFVFLLNVFVTPRLCAARIERTHEWARGRPLSLEIGLHQAQLLAPADHVFGGLSDRLEIPEKSRSFTRPVHINRHTARLGGFGMTTLGLAGGNRELLSNLAREKA